MVDRFEESAFEFFTVGSEDARQMLFEFEKGPPWSCLSVACGLNDPCINRDEYSRAKDRARARAHVHLRERRQRILRDSLLSRRTRNVGGDPTVWADTKRAVTSLDKFSKKYKKQHFLRGLLALLLEQQRHSVVLRWCLDNTAIITDAGTEQFIVDAAHLLCDLFVVVHHDALTTVKRKDRLGRAALTLELSASWSNPMLSRLVKKFSVAKKKTCPKRSPQFVFDETCERRPNIDGRNDETPPYLDLLVLDINSTLGL